VIHRSISASVVRMAARRNRRRRSGPRSMPASGSCGSGVVRAARGHTSILGAFAGGPLRPSGRSRARCRASPAEASGRRAPRATIEALARDRRG
jgi:hypothetical protein